MNKSIIFFAVILIIAGVTACVTDPLLPDGVTPDPNGCTPGTISFKKEIQPIISANCAFSGCHDAISAEEGVVLDTYENIMKEVTPNKPNKSELYTSLLPSSDDIMPPSPYDLLSAAQITLIKDWINQGAEDLDCGGCDTTTVTFSATVSPIIQAQCAVCHNDSRQDGGVNLANYQLIKAAGQNGSLMGTIEHQTNYKAMPPSGVKIDQCFIDQIKIWMADGMPNN